MLSTGLNRIVKKDGFSVFVHSDSKTNGFPLNSHIHLSELSWITLFGKKDNSHHYHSSDRARANHTGTQDIVSTTTGTLTVARGGTGAVDAPTARTNLGVEIGIDVQAWDATLQSISALGTAADRIAYTTALDTWAETMLTSFARTVLDDADAVTVRTTLGVAIGSDVQAYDATLQSLSALGTAADKIAYTTALDTWAETPLTAFARTLIDDADAAAGRVTLEVVIGTNVQAWAANLDTWATKVPPAGTVADTAYVDLLVTGLLEFKGDIDASLNPDYPAANKGDTYLITVAGKIGGAFGKTVNIGDMVVAKEDNAGGNEAAVGTSWFVVESNRDQASETVKGVAELATQAETDAGVDDERIVTPLKLVNLPAITDAFKKSTDDTDDITEGATNKFLSVADKTDLTDAGDSALHFHATDRARANHTGTQDIDSSTAGTLPITRGGTGNTAATAAFDALAPTTTQGDVIYHDGSDNVRLAKGTKNQQLSMNSGATAPEWQANRKFVELRCLDKDTAHTVTTNIRGDWEAPFGGTFNNVFAYVDTAGTTGVGTVDINKNAVTIISTKITIDSTEKTSRTAVTPPVISVTTFVKGDIITIDIDGIQTTPAKGLAVLLDVSLTDF